MKKRVLITGATDGIGKQLAFDLAAKGYRITLHGRNNKRLEASHRQITETYPETDIILLNADFADLKQTAQVFEKYKDTYGMPDILINNAGTIIKEKNITADGYEENFQVNYLAPFLLTKLLTEGEDFSEEHRIINVSSMIHANELDFDNLNAEKSFNPNAVYATVKLCNILFTNKLVREFEGTKLVTASVHPGVIDTKLLRTQWGGGAPVKEGSENVLYTVDAEALRYLPGAYVLNRRPMEPSPIAHNKEVQDNLWIISMEMLKGYLEEKK
ncbi:MAG: SDR family NAD(P)-dependent oxidoreductase [Bacteroidota bacterium]|nr:SDR family NAD(P)-dependent oxidoreductase [Bacteroidota bacterium]